MNIILYPIAKLPGEPDDAVSVSGEVLTVNGTDYDLSSVPEGGEGAPQGDHPFVGVVTREDGEIACGLRFGYSTETALSDQSTDPADWVLTLTDGPLVDPVARKPEEDEE